MTGDDPLGIRVIVDQAQNCVERRETIRPELCRVCIEVDSVDGGLSFLRQFPLKCSSVFMVPMQLNRYSSLFPGGKVSRTGSLIEAIRGRSGDHESCGELAQLAFTGGVSGGRLGSCGYGGADNWRVLVRIEDPDRKRHFVF